MLGMEILLAGWLAAGAGPTAQPALPSKLHTPVVAQIQCEKQGPPRINIVPSKSDVKYDFTRSKAQLNQVDIDTVSPYGPNHQTAVSGLMSGSIYIRHEMHFQQRRYDQLGVACLYMTGIDIKVHVEPTVYVAREYPPRTCMHEAVLRHERKHVREDQLIVNKYSSLIGQGMQQMINSQKGVLGPFATQKIPHVQGNIQRSYATLLQRFNKQMNKERRARQQAIDSYEEYESIGRECPERGR